MNRFFALDLPEFVYTLSDRLINQIATLFTPTWDPKLLGIAQLPIQSVFDVGANNGQFSQKILKIFPKADLYIFEPLPKAVQQLERWKSRQNSRGNIQIFPIALGDRNTNLEIHQHLHFSASSSLLSTTANCEQLYPMTRKQKTITVQQFTLDHILNTLPSLPTQPMLIKLDVQGYEDRVIRGGTETFQRAIACIVEISLTQLYENQATFRDIFQLLDQLDYQYIGNLDQVQQKNGQVLYINAVFMRDIDSLLPQRG